MTQEELAGATTRMNWCNNEKKGKDGKKYDKNDWN